MKKRFSGPQIVAKLRQADVLIGQGKAVPEVCKEIEISQQTYYRWQVETVYSMIKRNLTDTLLSRSFWAQCREICLLAITHNLMIIQLVKELFYRAKIPNS